MPTAVMRSTVLVLALAAGLLGCSPAADSSSAGSSATSSASSSTRGESPSLTSQLTPVPGFRYADISEAERAMQLAALPSHITAAAFHGVVDESSGIEVVFLALYEGAPGDAAHAADYAEPMAAAFLEVPSPEPLIFAGQRVWFAEEADDAASRYQYFWDRQGTLGWVDGPDRATTERFLDGYFTALDGAARSDPLERPVMDVPGYSFTRAVDQASELDTVLAAFPGATDARLMYVFDHDHAFGGLVLTGPVPPMTGKELVSAAQSWKTASAGAGSGDLAPGPDLLAGDVVVHRLDGDGVPSLFVWQWPDTGVVGWFATSRPGLGVDFVSALVERA